LPQRLRKRSPPWSPHPSRAELSCASACKGCEQGRVHLHVHHRPAESRHEGKAVVLQEVAKKSALRVHRTPVVLGMQGIVSEGSGGDIPALEAMKNGVSTVYVSLVCCTTMTHPHSISDAFPCTLSTE